MSDDTKKGFSGIFGGLKKMVFTEEYLDTKNEEVISSKEKVVPTPSAPSESVSASPALLTSNSASDEMVKKIYALLESMNRPGVDFFELWNAAEAMGGANASNLQNAFTTFKILGLQKETVLTTGEAYCVELQTKLNADIQNKKDEKENILLSLEKEKQQLQRDKQDFENKLNLLQSQLVETTAKLSEIDSKYTPQVQEIETKIQAGSNALSIVISQIKSVLEIVKTTLK